jgi:glycosyltransferase involved in cell wall biosynthesis
VPLLDQLSADELSARERYHQDYPGRSDGGLVVVIAAYNEEKNIGSVLAEMPGVVLGMPVTTIVVVDGAADATAEVARGDGRATVAELPRNRGQGVALRCGYQLALDRGARIVATLDADGQFPPSDLPAVCQPILDDRADFVSGSRTLGHAEKPTLIRRIGTVVFAYLISVLVLQRITDTSNGLRAMRAEVLDTVTLAQPQYQASELLIGVFAGHFRVLEVATTMRRRGSGKSKKGPNWKYGLRFARVILGTYVREFSRKPYRRG